MMQMASLSVLHPDKLPEMYKEDAEAVLAYASQSLDRPFIAYSMYRADPFERIAYSAGEAIQHFLQLHNITGLKYLPENDIIKARRLIADVADRNDDESYKNLSLERQKLVQHYYY